MRNVLMLIMMLTMSVGLVIAQPPKEGKHCKPRKHKNKLPKEAKEELRSYHEQNVYPVLKAAHDKFEAGLSTEDLAFLQQKRTEAKALHVEAKEARNKAKAARKEGKSREEIKAEMGPIKEEMMAKKKALMDAMKPFIERNQELLKSCMEPLKEEHKKWREDEKAIREKYMTDEQKQKMTEHHQHREKHRGDNPDKTAKHKKHGKGRAVARFLFWDGEKKEAKDFADENNNTPSNKTKNFTKVNENSVILNNYPNPAIDQTTITVKLAENTKKATLFITDAQGKQVWKRTLNKLDAGEYKYDVNLKKFTNGQYFYTLQIGEEQITKTLVVNK